MSPYPSAGSEGTTGLSRGMRWRYGRLPDRLEVVTLQASILVGILDLGKKILKILVGNTLALLVLVFLSITNPLRPSLSHNFIC